MPGPCDTTRMNIASIFVLLLLVLVALAISVALNRWWISAATPKPSRFPRNGGGLASCGQCGYAVRGIQSLICPECGADLREVGIIRPGQSGSGAAITVLIVMLYSITFLIASIVAFGLIASQLPDYARSSADIDLTPNSQLYDAAVAVKYEEIIWQGSSYSSHYSGMGSTTTYDASGNVAAVTLDFGTPGNKTDVSLLTLSLAVTPALRPPGAWNTPIFEVDPATRHAQWTRFNGTGNQSRGPFTDQDILSFLSDVGIDTTRQDVIDESKQLYVMLDGLATHKNRITLVGFDNWGQGGSGSYSSGPPWFGPAYALAVLVLWIIGLIFVIRRRSRSGGLKQE